MDLKQTPEQAEAALWLRWPEIEAYFAANRITGPFPFTDAEAAADIEVLIVSHIDFVRAGLNRKWATPYLRRLEKIMIFHQSNP